MTQGSPVPAASASSGGFKRIMRALRSAPALAIIPLLALLLSACGTTTTTGGSGVLVFGAPVSLTGATSHEGQDTLNGYKLWAKTVNAHGGIKVGDKTYTVQIKSYDDGSSPTKSAQLTQQLITTDKVNFLLGPYGTPATLQDETIAQQYQIPMVEGNGAASSIFSQGNKYIFGVLSPAGTYASIMIEAALSLQTPPTSVAIISANDAFSLGVAKAAKTFATNHNLKVCYYQEYPANTTDLTNVLTALKTSCTSTPDFILGSGHEGEAIVTMKEAKQLGINAKLYGFTVGPALSDFATTLSGDANYVIGSSQWTAQVKYQGTDVFGTAANFEQMYKAEYNTEPSYQAADGAAAALAFQFAIEKAGSIDPAKVRDALAGLDVTTFYGQLKFDSTGANTYKPMVTIQIQNGQVVTVYPSSVANATLQYPTPPFGSR